MFFIILSITQQNLYLPEDICCLPKKRSFWEQKRSETGIRNRFLLDPIVSFL